VASVAFRTRRRPVPNRSHCSETSSHSASATSFACVGIASANSHFLTVCAATLLPGYFVLNSAAMRVGLERGQSEAFELLRQAKAELLPQFFVGSFHESGTYLLAK
jgi:hypothetical protein